jgi:hypothetical protein
MKFLKWIDGKKTIFAEFYWTALAGINLIWFPDGMPTVYNKVYLSIGIFFTFIGLGHKAFKSRFADKETK